MNYTLAKRDFGSGNRKVGKGMTVVLASGSSNPGFITSQITETVNDQLGIN